MSDVGLRHERLPRNFHCTFIPERQYVNALLRFAAAGLSGDVQEIAKQTGIPTGASSGKVSAILDYARGMGLVRLSNISRSAVKAPDLTPFGRVVLLEDPYMKEAVTQWIAHFNLCGELTGADVWYRTFFEGAAILGMSFTREQLEQRLSLVYATQPKKLVGPMVRTYEDEAALGRCGVVSQHGQEITRMPAPVGNEFIRGFGAWMLQLLADHFPGAGQVTVTELDAKGGWQTIPGWDVSTLQRVLTLMETKGLFGVDRHMQPWILRPATTLDDAWKRLYDDLL